MNKKIGILLLVMLISNIFFAQNSVKLILKSNDELHPRHTFIQELDDIFGDDANYELKSIYRALNVYKLEFTDPEKRDMISIIENCDQIQWVVEDQILDRRAQPNDEYFNEQWYLERIQAINSWDITRGGLSPLGDTIVVAVLDDGFYPDHEDLKDNVWHNWAEIPDDGVDNDQNGYVDDFIGWNFKYNNGQHSVMKHGTAVAGIIGARGNNTIGISGTNWQVKLLLLSETNSVADVIEAYQYVIDMRERYDASGGTEGAYIVASNLSSGLDQVFPEDNPAYMTWCSLYDDLGQKGILSVNATTNSDTDIDVEGDMPATCTSDYLIVVTNSDKNDSKVTDAGYGKTHVDIAAPGSDILTTSLADKYESFTGTSSSTPLLAGAIALLYSAPCESFAMLSKNNPASGASHIKSMIMGSADKSDKLSNLVKSEGRLNIYGSMELMREFCGGSTGELEILEIKPNPIIGSARVLYESANFEPHLLQIHNLLGQLVWSKEITPSFFGDKQYQLNEEELDFLGGVANGYYILSLSQQKSVSARKILIMN